MAMNYPNRKGYLYSFIGFSLLDGADLLKGMLGFKATPKIEGGDPVFGTGPVAYGFTRGTFSCEVELTFLAEAWFDFARSHPQFLVEIFDFTGINEEGSRRDKIEIISCRLNSADFPMEGTDAIKVAIPGIALDMKINGQRPIIGDSLGINNDAGGG